MPSLPQCWRNRFPGAKPAACRAAPGLHFGLKKKEERKNCPSSPQGVSAVYLEQFRASTGVLRAPGCPGIPSPGSLWQHRTWEQCLVCTANAEAAIYCPVLAAEVQKIRQLHQKAASEEPVQQALQRAARFPASAQSCCSPEYDRALQGTHRPGPNYPPSSKTTTLHLVCTPPSHTHLCPALVNKPRSAASPAMLGLARAARRGRLRGTG